MSVEKSIPYGKKPKPNMIIFTNKKTYKKKNSLSYLEYEFAFFVTIVSFSSDCLMGIVTIGIAVASPV